MSRPKSQVREPRNVSPEAQALLPKIRALLEQEVVIDYDSPKGQPGVALAAVAVYKTDPAFAQLLHVVCFPCPFDAPHIDCGECENTGYVTRDWTGQPAGALEGAIDNGVLDSPFNEDDYESLKARGPSDDDLSACMALLAALQARAEARAKA